MKPQVARELVVRAGRRLVETGLIARTWGNVSCRISSNMFVITPSGRDYMSLTPDEIVTLRIPDLSYSGDIKPSSEKGVHAAVYTMRPDIGFVIHTHQPKASAGGSLGLGSLRLAEEEVICAAYGLPGTGKLRKGVVDALGRSTKNALIMRNHGALCFGRDFEETFAAAAALEDYCESFLRAEYLKRSGKTEYDANEYRAYALHADAYAPAPRQDAASVRAEGGFNFRSKENEAFIAFSRDTGSLAPEQRMHRAIYLRHPKINAIAETSSPGVSAVARKGARLLPLLDDFAQIAGHIVRSAPNDPEAAARAFGSNSAILVREGYALCAGGTESDARAVAMVMDKNCEAWIAASLFGRPKPIGALDCALMRLVYQRKYAALANK